MKSRNIWIGSLLVAGAALLVSPVSAQAQTETEITGTVVRVHRPGRQACLRGNCGTRLLVQSGDEFVRVRVAPRHFLQRHRFGFARGDQVAITGWGVRGRNNALIARRISRGHRTLVLRGARGGPRWHRGPHW